MEFLLVSKEFIVFVVVALFELFVLVRKQGVLVVCVLDHTFAHGELLSLLLVVGFEGSDFALLTNVVLLLRFVGLDQFGQFVSLR